jgi:hypothetical protein
MKWNKLAYSVVVSVDIDKAEATTVLAQHQWFDLFRLIVARCSWNIIPHVLFYFNSMTNSWLASSIRLDLEIFAMKKQIGFTLQY